ncbi:MAG TPA: hypothetical protein VFP84_36140 [Kofleriaceae bacterium]|nr:hypothetical protein [Kofleriaceae bacterium]
MRLAAALVLVAACSDPPPPVERHLPTPAERAAAPPSSAERMFVPADAAPAAPAHRTATMTPVWRHVTSSDNCFFFSGPDGRDDPLTSPAVVERDGEAVAITIGRATFTGTFRAGELFARRTSHHESLGAWTVTETLHGHYRDGLMTADYHYAECGPGPQGPCPARCTIDGKLALQR